MALPQPDVRSRYRCASCGNLTRFDVTRRTRVTEYVHQDLAGAARVEETHVHRDDVEQVRCRWCDRTDSIEIVPRQDGVGSAGT